MRRNILFVATFLIFFMQSNFAQIDTTDVYPLHRGNYWEYSNNIDIHYYQVVVDSETMSNGKTYKKRMSINLIENNPSWDTSYSFWRVENEQIYTYWANREQKMYDLSLSEGSVWIIDSTSNVFRGCQISIKEKSPYYLTGDTLTYFFMEYVYIDTSINNPDTSVILDVYDGFRKGIGDVFSVNGIKLIGAIINGQKYGYITVDVEDDKQLVGFSLMQNYPNPFNPSTVISYRLPVNSHINLIVYDILGRKVVTLVNEEQIAGNYNVTFYGSGLSSGVYIYKLESAEFSST